MPHRYGGLSGSYTITAGDEVGARLQALGGELQAHEAELDLAARTDDVLAARFVVLHLLAAGGTGPDRRTRINPLHLREVGGPAVLEELDVVVDAAVVVAAVGARRWTLPCLQTLPAEVVTFPLVRCAECALNAEVTRVLSLHTRVTPGTLMERM